jgi:nucleoside phosphorylase
MPCAVIITSLAVEYLAVRKHLENLREVIHPQGSVYETGHFSPWDVGVVEIGAGNYGAALEVERAIAYFKPEIILFVGIAGGIKDVAIGDVVAVREVYGYESGTFGSTFFLARPALGQSDFALVQRARAEARKEDWLKRGEVVGVVGKPMVVVGAIVAGEKVFASSGSELYMFLRSNYSDAVAVEMEGFGALAAVMKNPVSTMVIRGISDVLGIYPEMEIPQGQAQKIASQNASAFAFELLAKLNIENNISAIQRSQEIVTIDLDEEEGIDRPFDPAQIRIESKNMTIDLLLKRIQHGELNLSPDFQRVAGIWKPAVQSRLIESLLIRIPLPAFYVDATDDEGWAVIDGLQRLTTLKSFALDKKMKLEGLEFLQQFKGFSYDELPRDLQRRIEETQVTVYLIGQGTPPEVKFNIFKRINTGGLPLSTQEIRHALNQGKATQLIKFLSNTTTFIEATGVSSERMVDQELVLRFLAFIITSPENYRSSDFDSFLNNTMVKINHMNEDEITALSNQFDCAVQYASKIFGSDAFRKPKPQKKIRNPVNKSLFESWCVNLAQITPNEFKVLEDRKYSIVRGFEILMENTEFSEAISQGTGSTKKVRKRFEGVKTLISHCLSNEYEDMARLEKLLSGADDNSELLPIAASL